jgi:hypothetical protein
LNHLTVPCGISRLPLLVVGGAPHDRMMLAPSGACVDPRNVSP